ncbi:hemolysin-type calcium-binding protein, partial [Rhizobiaceae sp. 2RAB30]
NLGSGAGDTINLTSTSADLNTLGANNNSIQGVEAISAAGAASGVTLALGGQSEACASTGSNQNDVITGGTGADTIQTGGGDDTVNIATGQFVAGEILQGGADSGAGIRDQIVLTGSSATVDFSLGTVSGFETLTGTSGSDTVTMTTAQWAGFNTINLGNGTSDVLNVVAGGDLTALSAPTVSGVEALNLVGTSGNDVMTLSG